MNNIKLKMDLGDPKYEIYGPKCDRKDIVDFIKQVEKYPCLYDKTNPAYANKFHNRKAWVEIARRANTTVPDCRDKWRKIRISFMRSLKQQQSDKPPMRPYYLTEELLFLLPFVSVGQKEKESNKLSNLPQQTQLQQNPVVKQELSDDEETDSSESNHDIETITFTETPTVIKRHIGTVHEQHNGLNNDDVDMNGHLENSGYLKRKRVNSIKNGCDDVEYNARKMFLLSILPDVESLSEQEMRVFRRAVIDIVDTIMNKRI